MVGTGDFINKIAKKEGITQDEAKKRVTSFLDVLTEVVKEQGGITFRGYFSLQPKVIKAKEGVFNGVAYSTKEKKGVKFKIGKEFEQVLNS